MGDRPDLRPEDVESSICDGAKRPVADRRIKRIPLSPEEQLKFSEWEPIEAEYLRRLDGREALLDILEAKAFPKLHGSNWDKQAAEFIEARDGTQFGVAMAWVGDTIDALQNGRAPRPPGRPWSGAFDRAEARSPDTQTSRAVFADWLADEVWSLKWADDYNFELARTELATRLTIGEDICARLRASGSRADRAAAEAVMIVEVVGESDFWTEVKDCMRI